jgi:hypothetical protein
MSWYEPMPSFRPNFLYCLGIITIYLIHVHYRRSYLAQTLARLAKLPLTSWTYSTGPGPKARSHGPMQKE